MDEFSPDAYPKSRIDAIAIHSQKGGPGKTTFATNLAAELARRGNKTLLVDLDIGGGTTQYIFGLKAKEISTTINDILLGKKIFNKDSASPTRIENLYVLISKTEVKVGEGLLNLLKAIQDNAFFRLIELINCAKRVGFSYIVFDCTPGWKVESLYALCVSDVNLFILRPSTFSFEGAKYMLREMYKDVDTTTTKEVKPSTYFLFNQTPSIEEDEITNTLELWKNELIDLYKPKKIVFLGKIAYSDQINNAVIRGDYIAKRGTELYETVVKIADRLIDDINDLKRPY
ncbi:MAG: ParA family protein [Candidatus Heimdallarchaeaceae archaeon]